MDDNHLYYSTPLNDSPSFELAEYPPTTPTPGRLPNKPRKQRQCRDQLCISGPHYPEDVSGPINFDFSVIIGNTRYPIFYSKMLKRIYTTPNQALRICFTWLPTLQPLYLRSAVLYAEHYHVTTPVRRCYVHSEPELPHNVGVSYDQLKYVFRVSSPADIYENVYETNVNAILTTKTTLRPNDGQAWLDYIIFCQNSCATGIRRRATKFAFQIEDAMGVIIASRSLLIQVCKNPKRDMERDENRSTSISSNSTSNSPNSTSNSPKTSQTEIQLSPSNSQDETVCALNVDILGEENYKAVIKYAYDIMASDALRTGNQELFQPHMDALLKRNQGTI